MGGGTLPKGFPVSNPTTSYWQIPEHHIANHRSTKHLPTEETWDYIIIGSGISGAAIAYKLLSRNSKLRVLMLEARTAASAASGRNGGHCRAGWWLNFANYVERHGAIEALKFERLEEQNVADIANFVKENDVDCDFEDVETADCYSTEEGWEGVKDVLRVRKEVGKRHGVERTLVERRVWEGKEAERLLGLEGVVGCVTYKAHTQNPYLLVCRMLEMDLGMGMELQTSTPILKVQKGESGEWEVETDRGTVRGSKVVLATNAYTNVLCKGLADTGFLRPSRSQVTALRPGKDLGGHPAARMSCGVNDRGSGDYFMIRAPGLKGAGDVLYGGGRYISKTREMGVTDDSVVNEDIAKYLKESAPEVFGSKWGAGGEEEVRDWSGITCYTPDTFPLVGEVPGEDGLWASVGMNGHGMAMAFRSAEALAEMMTTGKEPEWFPRSFRIARAWDKS